MLWNASSKKKSCKYYAKNESFTIWYANQINLLEYLCQFINFMEDAKKNWMRERDREWDLFDFSISGNSKYVSSKQPPI